MAQKNGHNIILREKNQSTKLRSHVCSLKNYESVYVCVVCVSLEKKEEI